MAYFFLKYFIFLLPFSLLSLSYLETLSPCSLVTPNVDVFRGPICDLTALVHFAWVNFHFLTWL